MALSSHSRSFSLIVPPQTTMMHLHLGSNIVHSWPVDVVRPSLPVGSQLREAAPSTGDILEPDNLTSDTAAREFEARPKCACKRYTPPGPSLGTWSHDSEGSSSFHNLPMDTSDSGRSMHAPRVAYATGSNGPFVFSAHS